MMNKILAAFFIVCFSMGICQVVAADNDTVYVASKFSDRYHLPTCKIAGKIAEEDKLIFKSLEEAAAVGYGPCKKCNPYAVTGNFSKRSG